MTAANDGPIRTTAIERLFNGTLAWLVGIGLVRGHFYVLEVPGRKTGRTISMPVDLLEFEGRRYLVSARGESNWVHNARAAGEIVLKRGRRRERFTVIELLPERRPPVLKAYLDSFASEVQRFFAVPKGSPVADFVPIASRHPVFELRPPS